MWVPFHSTIIGLNPIIFEKKKNPQALKNYVSHG